MGKYFKRATQQICKWPFRAQPASNLGIIHLCHTVTIQSKYQPSPHICGLTRPPNLSLVGRHSPQLSRGSRGAQLNRGSRGAQSVLRMPVRHSIPDFHPLEQLVGSEQKVTRGDWRGITRWPSTSSRIQQHPQTVLSTYYVQGTCLSFKININKPLYSFALSFKLCNFCIPSATCHTSITTLWNCFQCAFRETVPDIASIPSLLRSFGYIGNP